MRVLLTNHGPLAGDAAGRATHDLAVALQAAGHQVRCLIDDHPAAPSGPLQVRRIVCHPADPQAGLHFALPAFTPQNGEIAFESLTDDQIEAYRDEARRQLDAEVDQFDPQVIHAQHIWLHAQLALETGVPYVITAWGPELVAAAADPRYRVLAEQAAENAGRIFTDGVALQRRVIALFDGVADRTVVMPARTIAFAEWTAEMYQAVLTQRFGAQPDTLS